MWLILKPCCCSADGQFSYLNLGADHSLDFLNRGRTFKVTCTKNSINCEPMTECERQFLNHESPLKRAKNKTLQLGKPTCISYLPCTKLYKYQTLGCILANKHGIYFLLLCTYRPNLDTMVCYMLKSWVCVSLFPLLTWPQEDWKLVLPVSIHNSLVLYLNLKPWLILTIASWNKPSSQSMLWGQLWFIGLNKQRVSVEYIGLEEC